MKLVTPELRAACAAEGFRKLHESRWSHPRYEGDKKSRYQALVALGPNPSPADVDRIVENDEFTRTFCDSCFERNVPVMEVVEEDSWDSIPAHCLCRKCLQKAIDGIEGTQ